MSGPFKMKGSGHYGHGNQKRKDGMPFAQYLDMAKQVGGAMSKNNEEKTPAQYASPAKSGDKPKHQKGGSYTYKGKTYSSFAALPDNAQAQIYKKNVKEYGGTGGKNRIMTNPDGSLKPTGTENRDAVADSDNTN